MQKKEAVRFVLFMALLMAVTMACLAVILDMTLRRDGWSRELPAWVRGLSLVIGVLELLALVDGFLIEGRRPEITAITLASRKLPTGAACVIVHLSDLHIARFDRRFRFLLKKVRESAPDLILITGDYVNHPRGYGAAREVLTALAACAPVFCTAGNVDVQYPDELDRLKKAVTFLDNGAVRCEVRGIPLFLAGADDGDEAAVRRAAGWCRAEPGIFSVLLYHKPDLALEADVCTFDLYLCGHTHGGQVRLPWFGAVLTLARHGKRFEAGIYALGERTRLYVNRGYGFEGGSLLVPRVRFLCRPEIAVFTLKGEA